MNEMQSNLGKPVSIVISFDVTFSMKPAIADVKQKLRELVTNMKKDIPDLKIGIIAHGDYCDAPNHILSLDLTDDLDKIMSFIVNAPSVSGGDLPECYELALHTARNMSWTEEGGSLILIGDDEPHTTDYRYNTDHLDWRVEAKALKERNINIFPMQCLYASYRGAINNFWEEISQIAGTPLLILDSFTDSSKTIESCLYASAGTKVYNNYLHASESVVRSANLCSNVEKLKGWTESKK